MKFKNKITIALMPATLFIACVDTCDKLEAPLAGSIADTINMQCKPDWKKCEVKTYCASFDQSIDDEVKRLSIDAMLDWEISLNGSVEFRDQPGCQKFKIAMHPGDWFQGESYGARAYTANGEIALNSERVCGSKMLNFVLRHELGHVLGLSHDYRYPSVMYDTYMLEHDIVNVEPNDVEQFARIHQCCPKN